MKKVLAAILIIAGFSGCLKGSNEPVCTYDACGVKAPASEIQAVQAYVTSNGIAATQHCSGLFYTIDLPGTGTTPTVCNTIVMNYEGRLTNGTVFDKTTTTPLTITLSQLITGFKNGLPLIKAGGKITLYVPPSLGYGSSQAGSIPPNSILIFSVQLLGVQ